ncbi:MAG: hypothetical protein ACR5LG_00235 [Sodalis sp. (in: enterobacteria)]
MCHYSIGVGQLVADIAQERVGNLGISGGVLYAMGIFRLNDLLPGE